MEDNPDVKASDKVATECVKLKDGSRMKSILSCSLVSLLLVGFVNSLEQMAAFILASDMYECAGMGRVSSLHTAIDC